MYIYLFKNPWKIFRIAACIRRGNSSYVHFDNFCNLLPDYILDYLKALYYVCVKRITLYNCLCSSSLSSSPSSRFSASRVWNIGASYIWDFGHCHNIKSHVCSTHLPYPVRKRIRAFQRTTQASDKGCPCPGQPLSDAWVVLWNAQICFLTGCGSCVATNMAFDVMARSEIPRTLEKSCCSAKIIQTSNFIVINN